MFAALAAPVSYNPAAPHRVHPNATSWRHTCATVRRMRSSKRRVNLRRASPPWVEMLTAPGSSSAQAALVRAAAQLERDLADRNVLCSKIVGEACVVTPFNITGVLTICLPPSARVRASRMCEPWGEAFQQHGGAIGNFTTTACVSFDTFKISRWWKAMRAATPFLTSTADPRLAALLKAKHFASRFQKTQRDPASVAARVAHFGRLLNLSLHRSHDAAASLVKGAAGAATTAAARAVAAASDVQAMLDPGSRACSSVAQSSARGTTYAAARSSMVMTLTVPMPCSARTPPNRAGRAILTCSMRTTTETCRGMCGSS